MHFQDVSINKVLNSIIYFLVSRSDKEFLEISLAFAQGKLRRVNQNDEYKYFQVVVYILEC